MSRKDTKGRPKGTKLPGSQLPAGAASLQTNPVGLPAVRRSCAMAFVPLALLTLLAAIIHLAGQSQRPLWLDEAGTYWISQAGVLNLLQGIRTDGTPPLFYMLISVVVQTLGSREIALRAPSILAATALVPAIYAVTRLLAERRTALVAAALAAVSPLVHYYSVEARCYALLQLLTVAILYTVLRAMAAPGGRRWWIGLAVAQALQLWTHGYGVFLVPVPALVCLVAGGDNRIRLAMKAAVASGVGVVLYVPWLISALTNVSGGVGDWIAGFWVQTPPYAAVIRSLEVFGFGGLYPAYLGWLGTVPAVRPLSVPLTLGLLTAALVPWADGRPGVSTPAKHALLTFLLVPLLGSWLYSLLRQPLYLVGRYDTIVLPVFLILLAMGLDKIVRTRRLAGAAVSLVLAGFATASFVTALQTTVFPNYEDLLAAQHLTREAAPGDPVVSTGFRRLVVSYYLERAGHHVEFSSFPPEMAQHPGWYSVERILREPDRVAKSGEDLARALISAARQGRAVWVLTSEVPDVDMYLYRPLLGVLELDRARSREDCALFCLRVK